MSFDRGADLVPVRPLAKFVHTCLYRIEYTLQSKFEDFVQYRGFRIEVVVDAACLHSRLVSDLSKRSGGIALLSKKLCRDPKDKVS